MADVSLETVVRTRLGAVRGTRQGGIAGFKGVPYAAQPFGANRFLPPQRPERWDGVRDALGYGPTALMPGYPPPFDALLPNPMIPGDDCLNLNIWTPEPGASGLPVMVWIHGGAFVNGSGAVDTYDGTTFARDGLVLVTINYRLGADGFLFTEDSVANRGLLDQVAALEWVQENIAAFGGDPARVTIFGESAGAMSVATLLAMPRAAGLFNRAIAQSGAGHQAMSAATARKVSGHLARRLELPGTAAAISDVPLDRLLEAQSAVGLEAALNRDPESWGEVALHGFPWGPVVDGDVLPERPIDRIAGARTAPAVPVLVGTTTDEYRFFVVPNGIVDAIDESWLARTAAAYGLSPAAVDTYRSAREAATAGDLHAAVVTDWLFRVPAIRLAEACVTTGVPSHMYEFAWRSPLFEGRLGACHALDIPFVFARIDGVSEAQLIGPNAPRELGAAMHRAWTDFATTGDPGWPAYDLARRPVMVYGEKSRVVDDPAGTERLLWEGLR